MTLTFYLLTFDDRLLKHYLPANIMHRRNGLQTGRPTDGQMQSNTCIVLKSPFCLSLIIEETHIFLMSRVGIPFGYEVTIHIVPTRWTGGFSAGKLFQISRHGHITCLVLALIFYLISFFFVPIFR